MAAADETLGRWLGNDADNGIGAVAAVVVLVLVAAWCIQVQGGGRPGKRSVPSGRGPERPLHVKAAFCGGLHGADVAASRSGATFTLKAYLDSSKAGLLPTERSLLAETEPFTFPEEAGQSLQLLPQPVSSIDGEHNWSPAQASDLAILVTLVSEAGLSVAERRVLLLADDDCDVLQETCQVLFDEDEFFFGVDLVVSATCKPSKADVDNEGKKCCRLKVWHGGLVANVVGEEPCGDIAQQLRCNGTRSSGLTRQAAGNSTNRRLYPADKVRLRPLCGLSELLLPEPVLLSVKSDGQEDPAQAATGDGHTVAIVPDHAGALADARMVRNYLALALPEACFAVFQPSLDGSEDLRAAGVRLASELREFLIRRQQTRVSFVVFGTGGIIARAALPWLAQFADSLHAFVSLASPHLGVMPASLSWRAWAAFACARLTASSASSKGRTGWKGLLQELALEDARHQEDSLVFRLSGDGYLSKFKELILVAAADDELVSRQSAFAGFAGFGEEVSPAETQIAESGGTTDTAPPEEDNSGAASFWSQQATRVGITRQLVSVLVFFVGVFVLGMPCISIAGVDLTTSKRLPRLIRLGMLGLVMLRIRLVGLQDIMGKMGSTPVGGTSSAGCAETDAGLPSKMAQRLGSKGRPARVSLLIADLGSRAAEGPSDALLPSLPIGSATIWQRTVAAFLAFCRRGLGAEKSHAAVLRHKALTRTLIGAYCDRLQ
eukprot:TRINITY_DN70542_c0_g1_i1.p1 TRINITY_DN70542_c0_g1~~TRINITY_DN70542_c0_g1_i1.p1  ORF type:complete len:721 (+),score=147.95 TRINITY_DN70542_c0_g1_i1:104-2266(+)